MVLSQTFLSLLFITLSTVDASPLIRRDGGKGPLAVTRHFRQDGAQSTLPEKDRSRILGMMQENAHNKRSGTSVSVTNALYVYTAQVGVGKPAHNYTFVIDTGSSNAWVGANATNPYIRTKTSIDTGESFSITYVSANVTGEEFLDTVTLTSELVIKNQSIGVARSSNGFEGFDGIIGVGPVDLTRDTVNNTSIVPTVMDNLRSQGAISEEVLGVYFVPAAENDSGGELTFGGYDRKAITSPMKYVPLTATRTASLYWGINESVSYGDETILLNAAGIVDTGTTLIYLETAAFQKYQNATGGVLDNATGLLAISAAQYDCLRPLSFNIGGVHADLTPNAQIWPRSLNTVIGGNASAIYLVTADLGQSLSDIQFVNGYKFLERFYSVFDTTNKRIGFANTAYTNSSLN